MGGITAFNSATSSLEYCLTKFSFLAFNTCTYSLPWNVLSFTACTVLQLGNYVWKYASNSILLTQYGCDSLEAAELGESSKSAFFISNLLVDRTDTKQWKMCLCHTPKYFFLCKETTPISPLLVSHLPHFLPLGGLVVFLILVICSTAVLSTWQELCCCWKDGCLWGQRWPWQHL